MSRDVELFDRDAPDPRRMPLAARMRPATLEDIVGQEALLGPGRLFRRAIEADRLQTIILYGPPAAARPRWPR